MSQETDEVNELQKRHLNTKRLRRGSGSASFAHPSAEECCFTVNKVGIRLTCGTRIFLEIFFTCSPLTLWLMATWERAARIEGKVVLKPTYDEESSAASNNMFQTKN